MTTIELEYLCDACDRAIADGKGSLYIDFREVHAHRAAREEADQNPEPMVAVSIAELLHLPPRASWYLHHDACQPEGVASDYDIGVEQVRTWRQLLAWTAHLMDKRWLPDTTWSVLLGNAAHGRDRRIVELARGDAA